MPRVLDQTEIRVLGCLLEKQQTTPEYYPLTLVALTAACDQKSNREPVMELAEADVRGALDRLHAETLAWPAQGARVERWEHALDRRWGLDPKAKALMTVLLLRGAQTPGELRGRTQRLCAFSSLGEVEETLRRLAADAEPFVVELPRVPGQKEARWMHLAGGAPPPAAQPGPSALAGEAGALARRLTEIESRVEELNAEVARLLKQLGKS